MVEGSDKTDESGRGAEPRECMACRGSGQVISKLGGETSLVSCPWCEGRGVRIPGIDAQARWRAEQDGEQAPAEPSAAPADGGSEAG